MNCGYIADVKRSLERAFPGNEFFQTIVEVMATRHSINHRPVTPRRQQGHSTNVGA